LESLLPWITGPIGALAVLVIGISLFLAGKIHPDREFEKLEAENDQLRQENNQLRYALDTERKTTNELTAAGQVTNQLITALTTLAGGRKPEPPEGITAKDLAL
jgi:hypothetical protein